MHAQGSGVIIVAVQVGAVKIYVAATEALRKEERGYETQFTTILRGYETQFTTILRGYETQFTTKNGGKISLGPSYFVL
jgi:hypothetical protein